MHTKNRRITRLNHDGSYFSDDDIIIEAPLEIAVNGIPWAALMRTPGDDEALALGYCHTEGLLHHKEAYELSRTELPDGTTRMLLTITGGKERVEKMLRGRGVRMGFSCCGNRNAVRADELIRPMAPIPISGQGPCTQSVPEAVLNRPPQSEQAQNTDALQTNEQQWQVQKPSVNERCMAASHAVMQPAAPFSMSASSLQPASLPHAGMGGKLGHGAHMCTATPPFIPVTGHRSCLPLIHGTDGIALTMQAKVESGFSSAGRSRASTQTTPSPCHITGDPAAAKKPFSITPKKLTALLREAEGYQALFSRTGGTHFCALYDAELRMLAFAEDTGRHNALDKAAGQAFMQHAADSIRLVLLSSRLSFEMVQKSLALRARMVAGISAVTSKGVELADASGITLVGFLRNGRMNIYTHEGRMLPSQPSPCHIPTQTKAHRID